MALPTNGQKCPVSELQTFAFVIFQPEHPVENLEFAILANIGFG